MAKFGDRVGAILSSDAENVYFLGWGTYVANEIPPDYIALSIGRANPKIQLDSGSVVWGCECWWGLEDIIKDKLATYKNVVEVDINKVRKIH